jgi:chemotaxis signal transduction protein
MRLATPVKASPAKTEQIILFRVSGQLFAISSASVQEVRSADSMSGGATEISAPGLRKVRHVLRRGDRSLFIVNGAMHFGLHAAEGAQLFVLRKTRTALLIDGIEKMTTMTRLQALPLSFCHEERQWYRGLTALDQTVVAVVHPEGFLSPEELALLDAALLQADKTASEDLEGTNSAQ